MIQQILSTVISFFIIYGILYLFRKKKKQPEIKHEQSHPYYPPVEPVKYTPPGSPEATSGRPITRLEQIKIDRQMKAFLEKHPNHSFWQDHPEYVDKYLGDIDLSELDDALK